MRPVINILGGKHEGCFCPTFKLLVNIERGYTNLSFLIQLSGARIAITFLVKESSRFIFSEDKENPNKVSIWEKWTMGRLRKSESYER